jgi:hypothetical protein
LGDLRLKQEELRRAQQLAYDAEQRRLEAEREAEQQQQIEIENYGREQQIERDRKLQEAKAELDQVGSLRK